MQSLTSCVYHYLVDCSGSMEGDRIIRCQEFIHAAKDNGVRHSITKFTTFLDYSSVPLRAFGGTSIGDCLLKFAYDVKRADAALGETRCRKIILLTDCDDELKEEVHEKFLQVRPLQADFVLVRL